MKSLVQYIKEGNEPTFGYARNHLADLFMCMVFKSKKEDKLDNKLQGVARRTVNFVNSVCSRGQSFRYKRIYCLKKEYESIEQTAKVKKISNKYNIEFKQVNKIDLPDEDKNKNVKKFSEVNGVKFVIMQSAIQFNIFFSPDDGEMYTFELVLSKQKFMDE